MPRLLVLTAPDGYGKTTTAREYANVFKTHAAIDLERAGTDRALLLALLRTLSAPDENRAYLRQAQLSLAADESVPPLLAERVLDLWRDPGAPAAVVFDNADRLPAPMMPLLQRILARRPPQRAVIVCSRTPLDIDAGQIAPAPDTLMLETADLALSDEQMRALFAGTAIDPGALQPAIAAAQGRPVAALLLRRLQLEGRLAAALDRAGGCANAAELYDALQAEAFDSLSAEQRRAVEFCASVPAAHIEDVQAVLGRAAAEALRSAAATFPLVRIDRHGAEVHSLLRPSAAAGNAQFRSDLRASARAALRRGERDAAAERYIACGEREEAVKVLNDVLEHGATAAVSAVAALLGPDILERHPRWFGLTALLRRFDVPPPQNLANIQAHRARMQQGADDLARFALTTLEAHQLMHSGLLEQARERVHELRAILLALKRTGVVNALRAHAASRVVDTLRAALAVADGEPREGERLLKRARFAAGQFSMITASATVDGWLPIGLQNGDTHLIQTQCLRARESLKRSGLDMVLLDLDANEAFAGWVLGDDVMYRDSIKRVDERARVYRTRAMDHLLGCAGLRERCDPTGVEPLRRLIIAHLFAAGRTSGEEGLEHARRGLLFARELRQRLFVTLASLAVRERGGDPDDAAGVLVLSPRVRASFIDRMRSPN